jgi:hypothetical protein
MDTRGFHREGQPEDLLQQMINVLVLASDFPLMARRRTASAGPNVDVCGLSAHPPRNEARALRLEADFGQAPEYAVTLSALLYPVHLYASLRAERAGPTFESLTQLQKCYRMLYAVIGIMMVATVRMA